MSDTFLRLALEQPSTTSFRDATESLKEKTWEVDLVFSGQMPVQLLVIKETDILIFGTRISALIMLVTTDHFVGKKNKFNQHAE